MFKFTFIKKNKMKNRKITWSLRLFFQKVFPVIFLIFFSCAGGGRDIRSLVPEEAFLYGEIDNPSAFIENLDFFNKATGIRELAANMDAELLLRTALRTWRQTKGFSLDWFDLKKAAGFALLPSTDSASGMPSMVLFLPLRENETFDYLEVWARETLSMKAQEVGNYAVLHPEAVNQYAFPPKKSMNLKKMQSREQGALTIYGSFQAFRKSDSFSPLLAGLSTAGPEGADDPFEEPEDMQVTVAINEMGISLFWDLDYKKGGALDKFQKSFKSGSGMKALSRYIPASSALSLITNFSPASVENYLSSAVADPSSEKQLPFGAIISGLLPTLGAQSALSFDFSMIPDNSGMPEKLFFAAVVELNKKGDFRGELEKALSSLSASEGFLGNGVLTRDREVRGFLFDEVNFLAKDSAVSGSLLSLRLHYARGKAYILAGESSLDLLRGYVEYDGLKNRENQLDNQASVSDFWSRIPDDSQLILRLAPWKQLEQIPLPPMLSFLKASDTQQVLPGFIGFVRFRDGGVESGWNLNCLDIKALLSGAAGLLSSVLQDELGVDGR